MSVTSGFFNSHDGDRRYDAISLGRCFEGVITDGVLENIGNKFSAKPGGGMLVIIGSGKAWCKSTWIINDTDYPVTIPASDRVLTRIDAIVMEFDSTDNVRRNTISVVRGVGVSANSGQIGRAHV